MAVDVVSYLAGKGIKTWRAAGDEVTCHCFFCLRHQRDKGRLYISTDSGVFFCHVCGEKGGFSRIAEHFGDKVDAIRDTTSGDIQSRRRLLTSAMEVGYEGLVNNEEVLLWLTGKESERKQRGLSIETIEKYKLGFIGAGWSLTRSLKVPHDRDQLKAAGLVNESGRDFFTGPKLLIPYWSNGHVVQLRGRDYPAGKYQTSPGDAARLFNTDMLRGADEVVVCEGELDCLVLQQALALSPNQRTRKMAVVAVPGATIFPQGWVEYFKSCKRIYIAFDPDEAGKKGAIRVREALGPKARIVEMPEDLPKCDHTAAVTYRGWTYREYEELFAKAAHTGRRLLTVRESLDSLARAQGEVAVYPTGFPALDAQIDGGGMRTGSVTVLGAKTGIGKSLFATQLVVNQRRAQLEIPTLFFSMELTHSELIERLVYQYRFWEPAATHDDIAEAFAHVMVCDQNKMASREMLSVLEEFEEERGCLPKQLVVDHLQYFARQQDGGSFYERTTNAIMEVKALSKDIGAASLVLSQVSRKAGAGEPIDLDHLRDSGAVEDVADYVITIWRPDDALEPTQMAERTATLQTMLAKNRRGTINLRSKLVYASASLALVDPGDSVGVFRANAENQLIAKGQSYAQVRGNVQLALISGGGK